MTNERPENVWAATLPNGLRVRVLCKPDFQRSYAVFATCYGGADRRFRVGDTWTDTPAGVAHYLEHKLFDMPDGSDALLTLSENGADPNAFTSTNMTAYYFSCTDRFEENLRTLLRFVSTPYFTDASVAKEQGIIGQEIRMGEDDPDRAVWRNLMRCLLARDGARDAVAGTVESIAEITPETLYACHKAFYDPGNMMLCVIGDVDAERVAELAKQYTPAGAQERAVRDYGAAEDMACCETSVKKKMEVSMPTFAIGFKCPPAEDGTEAERMDIIGDLAAELLVGESSALYQRLYEQGVIDADFSCNFEHMKGLALLVASGDSETPELVLDELLAEAERVAREGVDRAQFERLKKSMLGRRTRDLDSFEGVCYAMCSCGFEGVEYLDYPALFHAVTPEDVELFVRENVKKERAALSVIEPANEQRG